MLYPKDLTKNLDFRYYLYLMTGNGSYYKLKVKNVTFEKKALDFVARKIYLSTNGNITCIQIISNYKLITF